MRHLWLILFAALPAYSQVATGSTYADGDLLFGLTPAERAEMFAAEHPNGGSLIANGTNLTGALSDSWVLTFEGWRESQTLPEIPRRINGATATSYSTGMMVLFGGSIPAGAMTNETWLIGEGELEAILVEGNLPPAREGGALLSNLNDGRLLLFGGIDAQGTYLSDTWAFDGSEWTELAPTQSPAPRAFATGGHDYERNGVILFGGVDDNGVRADTWSFNEDWTPISTATTPPARSHASTAVHSEGLLLLGGQDSAGQPTWDFWVYSQGDWEERAISLPPARSSAAIIGELFNDRVVVFGGRDESDNFLADTWVYTTPEGWVEQPTKTANQVLDLSDQADAVVHAGSFEISEGVRVTVKTPSSNPPLTILAGSNVTINGELILDGADGTDASVAGGEAIPGPGGYPGGLGAGAISGEPSGGGGPGGGAPGNATTVAGGNAGHGEAGAGEHDGQVYSSFLARPSIGGSGGGGGFRENAQPGGGGGAGGGALTILCASTIQLNGTIRARGGSGFANGGHGSGGAVRLVSQSLEGNGTVDVSGPGSAGRIRIETNSNSFTGTLIPSASQSTADSQPDPGISPTIEIVEIGGVSVTTHDGKTDSVDVQFSGSPVTFLLASQGLPTGTSIRLRIVSLNGTVSTVTSTPTAEDGTASATATLDIGIGSVTPYAEY